MTSGPSTGAGNWISTCHRDRAGNREPGSERLRAKAASVEGLSPHRHDFRRGALTEVAERLPDRRASLLVFQPPKGSGPPGKFPVNPGSHRRKGHRRDASKDTCFPTVALRHARVRCGDQPPVPSLAGLGIRALEAVEGPPEVIQTDRTRRGNLDANAADGGIRVLRSNGRQRDDSDPPVQVRCAGSTPDHELLDVSGKLGQGLRQTGGRTVAQRCCNGMDGVKGTRCESLGPAQVVVEDAPARVVVDQPEPRFGRLREALQLRPVSRDSAEAIQTGRVPLHETGQGPGARAGPISTSRRYRQDSRVSEEERFGFFGFQDGGGGPGRVDTAPELVQLIGDLAHGAGIRRRVAGNLPAVNEGLIGIEEKGPRWLPYPHLVTPGRIPGNGIEIVVGNEWDERAPGGGVRSRDPGRRKLLQPGECGDSRRIQGCPAGGPGDKGLEQPGG